MDPEEARRALGTVDQTGERLAASIECPPWRHVAFGAVMAGLVMASGAPHGWFTALYVCSMAAIVWLIRSDRRRNGVFVNGWRRGRTLPVAVGTMAIMLALIFLSRQGRDLPFPSSPTMLAGGLALALGIGLSVLFQRIYRAEIQRGVSR